MTKKFRIFRRASGVWYIEEKATKQQENGPDDLRLQPYGGRLLQFVDGVTLRPSEGWSRAWGLGGEQAEIGLELAMRDVIARRVSCRAWFSEISSKRGHCFSSSTTPKSCGSVPR